MLAVKSLVTAFAEVIVEVNPEDKYVPVVGNKSFSDLAKSVSVV